MAQQTLYAPVSGMPDLPMTNGPNLLESYVTQMFSDDSQTMVLVLDIPDHIL